MESRMIVSPNGTKRWVDEEGQLHREDGPAMIWTSGTEVWYMNGKRHREDGPAVIRSDSTVEWWLNGRSYSFTEWANALNFDQKTRLEMVLKWNPE